MTLSFSTMIEALRLPIVVAAGLGLGLALSAAAQTAPAAPAAAAAPIPQYGVSVNLEQARKAVAASVAEARKMGWPMAVAVVDNAGQLVAFERIDNTQTGSIAASQSKAVSAAWYRRSTKVFQDAVAGGGVGLRVMTLPGASAVEGGLPLVADGKVVGAIGVSGGSSDQDGVVAKAGAESLLAK
jgi:uncharacterized protein GlcG (DUF336 family)